jgi:hypothetical protein
MIKKHIKFKDFEGNDVEREYYFHLTKVDMTQLELSFPGGLEAYLKKMVAERKIAEIFEAIRKIVLTSYGERDDVKISFRKENGLGGALWPEFSGSPAFEALMLELMEIDQEKQEATALEAFVKGIMPRE